MHKPTIPKRFMQDKSKSIKISEERTLQFNKTPPTEKRKDIEDSDSCSQSSIGSPFNDTENILDRFKEELSQLKIDVRNIISEELHNKFLYYSFFEHLPSTEGTFIPFFNNKKYGCSDSMCELKTTGEISLHLKHNQSIDKDPVLYLFGNNYVVLDSSGTTTQTLVLEVKSENYGDLIAEGTFERLKNGVFIIRNMIFLDHNEGKILNFNDIVPFEMKFRSKIT